MTLVVFDCGGKRCALSREVVSQIVAMPALSRPPNLALPVAGFANRGGETIPVLRGAVLLGQPDLSADDNPYSHVVFMQAGGGEFGLLVDRVVDVREARLDDLLAAGPTDTLNGCVEGVIGAEPPVHLLAPRRLLLNSERERLAGLVAVERARIESWNT
jgi:chemotaxis signal transduction protein